MTDDPVKVEDAPPLHEQAAELEQLLPQLMRRLFTLEPNHPASELPVAQLRVCSILQAGPRTLSALSAELGISVSATTQIADRLERVCLVERTASPEDRRTKYLQLTPHGREMMRSRRETRVRRAEKALRQLSKTQRRTVIQAVHALLQAAESVATQPAHEDPIGVRQEQ